MFPDDWLRQLLRGLVRASGLLEAHGHAGSRLSMSEVFALAELSDSEILTQQDLAERLGLEKSTVSRLAANLERRGWLSRQRDPANRRFYRLRLTPQGCEIAKLVGEHFHAYHAAVLAHLTPAERAGLETGLTGLIRALDAVGSPRSAPARNHRAHSESDRDHPTIGG